MDKIKNYAKRCIQIGLACAIFYGGVNYARWIAKDDEKKSKEPCLIVSEMPYNGATVRTYLLDNRLNHAVDGSIKTFVDEKPFGSLDYVVDISSGDRVERKPTPEEYKTFTRLEKKAREDGMIH